MGLVIGVEILLASMFWTLYVFLLQLLLIVSSVVSSPTSSFAKWHHRLGHLCGSCLSTLVHQGCLGYVFVDSTFHCKGSLENIYNFHIRLVGLILFDHLTLFIRMYGVLHLLLPRVVTSIKLFLLMTILATHGFIS